MGTLALGLICLCVIVPLMVLTHRARRRRKDARLASQWEWALAQSSQSGCDLAYVQRVYQHARRGSKAIIVWHQTGVRQDAWFEGRQAPAGVYVLLVGGSGWGPHNADPRVFYVAYGGVIGCVPGDAARAWWRHQRREQLAS